MLGLILILGLVFIAIIVIFAILIYNGLVGHRARVKQSFADIDVQLKRRFDLIPNLIETVKGYTKHERETFENITKARTSWANAKTVGAKASANNMLTDALKSIMAVAENYPNLKANENFKMLQEELSGTETKIAYARQLYNQMVTTYNIKIKKFPDVIFANMFGFSKEELFEIQDVSQRENVKVKF